MLKIIDFDYSCLLCFLVVFHIPPTQATGLSLFRPVACGIIFAPCQAKAGAETNPPSESVVSEGWSEGNSEPVLLSRPERNIVSQVSDSQEVRRLVIASLPLSSL